MFTFNVDLGQLIIGGLIAIVGYLIKSQISQLFKRLEKHEEIIMRLVADVQRLIGINLGKAQLHIRADDLDLK